MHKHIINIFFIEQHIRDRYVTLMPVTSEEVSRVVPQAVAPLGFHSRHLEYPPFTEDSRIHIFESGTTFIISSWPRSRQFISVRALRQSNIHRVFFENLRKIHSHINAHLRFLE